MTVAQLLANADSREISEWMAYFRVDRERHERAAMDARAEQTRQKAKKNLKR